MTSSKAKISVVGLGYVGLPVALLTAKMGYSVTGIDLDEKKVGLINKRQDPIGDNYVSKNLKSTKLEASSDFKTVNKSDIVIICVPTPVKNDYQPDLRPLTKAVSSVAKHIRPKALVIIESTINPGVCDEVIIPAMAKVSGLKINKDFYVAHCPERINPGDEKWSVENIPRVIGASSGEGLELAAKFYESVISAPVKRMGSLKEAEAVKIVENSFRDVNIAFVNELALSFGKLGINVKNVIDGAATKPFAFMPHYPSIGVGGHCIPVDPYYLIEYARGYGFEHEFLSLARVINNRMPEFTVELLIDALNEIGYTIKDTKVLVLGLSYKPDVADDRESPSYKLIRIMKNKGAKVGAYDPYFPSKSTFKNLDQALNSVDAVVLATNHSEFSNLPSTKHGFKVFIDGKNVFKKADFKDQELTYRGIGT